MPSLMEIWSELQRPFAAWLPDRDRIVIAQGPVQPNLFEVWFLPIDPGESGQSSMFPQDSPAEHWPIYDDPERLRALYPTAPPR